MALRAVEKRSLPDKVFEQLTAEIVSGRYAPGSMIPSERELSEVLAVNRHVVREAHQAPAAGRPGQASSREAARRCSTSVRARDSICWRSSPSRRTPSRRLRRCSRVRSRCGPGSASTSHACARSAPTATCAASCSRSPRACADVADGAELLALDQQFWQRMLDGAGNLAYQLAFNSLIRAVHAQHDLSVCWLEQELGRERLPPADRRGDRRPRSRAAPPRPLEMRWPFPGRLRFSPGPRAAGASRELRAGPRLLPPHAHLEPRAI